MDEFGPRSGFIQLLRCYGYGFWWRSKRYGFLSHLDEVLRFVTNVLLPIAVAFQLVSVLVEGEAATSLQGFNVSLLLMIGVGHFVQYLQQRNRARPAVRDVYEIRQAQHALSDLLQALDEAQSSEVISDSVRGFLRETLNRACVGVCNNRTVRATLMLKDSKEDSLSVSLMNEETADHDPSFRIRLVRDSHGDFVPEGGKGLAGFAYGKGHTVYLPSLGARACWQLGLERDGSIRPKWLADTWKPSGSRRFKSVLSTPIRVSQGRSVITIAVLNLESPHRDSFGDADFHSISIIAGFLAQGLLASFEALKGAKRET